MKTIFAAAAFSLLLVGCSTQVDDYQDTNPKFELDRYFDGEVIAWGSGKPKREFLYVDDMADASIYVMNLNDRH